MIRRGFLDPESRKDLTDLAREDAVKWFAGESYTQTHNLPRDHEFLVDMEPTVRHFAVLVDYRAG